ncbi:MAG TPA: MOSC N-terminal beta barrel domain-containing protein [Gaiellaceae bacterium]|nr:MOSC N-terminal beta barrel domain-containing protein [Gaiellaceae bacterium]
MKGSVAWIAVAPVKALRLALVDEVELAESGPRGDRRFFLVDENGRLVNNKGLGILQQVLPAFDAAAGTLALRFPDGTDVSGEVELGDEIETLFWGETRPARRVIGPWSDALSELAGRRLQLVASADGAAVDRGSKGAATIVSTAALDALGAELDVDAVDGRRFRMHFGIDGIPAHAEDGWLGRRVRVGGAVVVPAGNVGRCAVTTQNPETGRPDLDTLKALGRYRGQLPATEPLPFGVYARVDEPGVVRLGDPVEPL